MPKFSFDLIKDSLSRFDILDLHITLSELVDLPPETSGERATRAYYDSMATDSARGHHGGGSNPYTGDDTPIGKTVL